MLGLLATCFAPAQQANVNLDYNPQKNTRTSFRSARAQFARRAG
jgi:hypothetical protein